MKKISAIVLLLVLLLTGCGNQSGFAIENRKWEFSVAQGSETGEILYCTEEDKLLYPDAEAVDIWCSMDDGVILISNNGTMETWQLSYALSSKEPECYIYDITYESETEMLSGKAVCGITEKYNDSDEYTLIISIGGYSVYFYETV